MVNEGIGELLNPCLMSGFGATKEKNEVESFRAICVFEALGRLEANHKTPMRNTKYEVLKRQGIGVIR